MTRGLELYASVSRQAASRLVGAGPSGWSGLAGVAAPLRYVEHGDPVVPGPGWVTVRPRLAGISGSDLALVTGRVSAYLTAMVGLPFVPGQEVVAEVQESVTLDDGRVLAAGDRVVVDPAPGSGPGTGDGRAGDGRAGDGGWARGVGGGGWSRVMLAHRGQLCPVPATLPDARAVLVDPLAAAVHAVDRARVGAGQRVLVVGAGAAGLCTVLALRAHTEAGQVAVVAKYPRQAELARRFGADVVFDPDGAVAGVRRATHAMRVSPRAGGAFLLGGVDVAFDAAGRASSLSTALRTTRAGGRVVLSGVPTGRVDLTPLWARGLELVGAARRGAAPSVLARAFALAAGAPLDGVVAATYPLTRWREALEHALCAGRLGAVRIAFDPTVAL
ncbi:zinc-binding dehydrogenase [Frankia sp. KB5]|uniref:zinc-dependent alcohol dehydrogenase n=1 Tax=Frankia sp. KB5 TaxID=683318 RepID=UPI000A11D29B|nr:zinc-binding dehydrogenase [Frankia sp. KB5]ORT52932.1 zinc-binding alcohol dehydrogenase [Frankia sp. KB5]